MSTLTFGIGVVGVATAALVNWLWLTVLGLVALALSVFFQYQVACWRNTRITFDGQAFDYYGWRGEHRYRIPLDEVLDLSTRQVGWGLQGYLVRAKNATFKFDGNLSDAGELVGLIRKALPSK